MRFDQYAGQCIVSNVRLHRDSHSQILTATETSSALTLARSNLIRLSSLDWTFMASLTCCISIVVSPPCGSSSFPACRGSALVKTMPSSLLPLVFICFPHPYAKDILGDLGKLVLLYRLISGTYMIFVRENKVLSHSVYCLDTRTSLTLATFGHLLLLKLGFSTKLHLHCLHLTCLYGLCHHPPLSNSGNVSGHHLAGSLSNKTGCWSSFVSFVANFSSVQFCHPCHLSSYSRWLCPLIWTWNSTMLSSPSPASCGLINHRAFFTDSTKRLPMLCVSCSETVERPAHMLFVILGLVPFQDYYKYFSGLLRQITD